jgi:hypothetical protein
MFVVTRVPFDGGMCSRHPTTAHGTDSGILGKNFRQSVRERQFVRYKKRAGRRQT